MAYLFLTIPLQSLDAGESELNAFLRDHKVLSIDRRWVEQGASSFWCFCLDYLDVAGNAFDGQRPGQARGKIDYKDTLNPADFAIFARLRDVRKTIAQTEAVPVYTIFTNEQLAQMVQTRATTRAALEKIAGVGDARLDKYGGRVLDALRLAWTTNGEPPGGSGDEASR